MAGILVGVDGSDHSCRALGWAMREAVKHHVPLTVMSVHPAPARPATRIYWAVPTYPENSFDPELARMAVQEFVDKVASEIDGTPEVTVSVATGDAAEELVRASHDADMLVVGSRGSGGVRQAPDGFGEQPGHAPRGLPCRGRPRDSLGLMAEDEARAPAGSSA